MTYETDNAEQRISQRPDTVETSQGVVSEAYQGMEAFTKQNRTDRQTASFTDQTFGQLTIADFGDYSDLHPTPPPRLRDQTPIPAPPLQWDHEAARRAGEEGDRRAQELLRRHGRRHGSHDSDGRVHPH